MIFDEVYSVLTAYLPPKVDLVLSVLVTFVLALIVMIATPIILGWVDRKFSARIQSRYGPIYVGKFGVLQNFADVVKLMGKNFVTNRYVDKFSYNIIPILSSILSFLIISLLPLGFVWFSLRVAPLQPTIYLHSLGLLSAVDNYRKLGRE
jgi:NADH:ubiquinone oxidoreductase subunit 1 (chain H)